MTRASFTTDRLINGTALSAALHSPYKERTYHPSRSWYKFTDLRGMECLVCPSMYGAAEDRTQYRQNASLAHLPPHYRAFGIASRMLKVSYSFCGREPSKIITLSPIVWFLIISEYSVCQMPSRKCAHGVGTLLMNCYKDTC